MRRKKLVGIGLVLILLLTVVGCSSDDNSESLEATELYVKVPDGKADVFVLNSDEKIIAYEEQVEAAKFTNLSSGNYNLVVGKREYELFKKTVTVEGTTKIKADLTSASEPPVTINVTTVNDISDFSVEVYKQGTKLKNFDSVNQEAVVKVWPGVIYDYQVKKDNYIKYETVDNVCLKRSDTISLKTSLIIGQKKEFAASESKTVNLGTLATGETAVVGISPLNFDPNNNTAVSASADIIYSQTSTSSSLVKLNSNQQSTSTTADIKTNVSKDLNQISQAKKLLDNRMRKLEKEIKLDQNEVSQTDNIQASNTAADLSTGTEKSFYVLDSLEKDSYSEVPAILKRKADNAYIFVEQGVNIDSAKLDTIANEFSSSVYGTNLNYFADYSYTKDNLYDIDGNGRPIVLITDLYDLSQESEGTIGGFFTAWNYLDKSTSNQADMIYINSNVVKNKGADYALSILAHEFQHLIYFIEKTIAWNKAGQPDKYFADSWINEGFSGLAEYLNGYYSYAGDNRINDSNGDKGYFDTPSGESLLYWNQKLSDYGASNLFGLYLYDQYGPKIIEKVNNTYKAPRKIVSDYTNRRFGDLFLDWILTNQITDQEISDRYSYSQSDNGVQVTLGSSPKSQLISSTQLDLGLNIKPNAVKYYKIEGNGNQVTLELKNFNQPAGVIIHRQ